jgi:hypothetical protein
MGKFYKAFEKFEKERLMESAKQKIKKSDYIALLQYDRATGKLDLFNRDVIKDFETPQRLLDNNLVLPDGQLSPEGLRFCKKYEKNEDHS